MIFNAEIKQTKQRKTASLDNVYQIVLETDNPMIMDLGKLGADTMFTVQIDIMDVVSDKPEGFKRLELGNG